MIEAQMCGEFLTKFSNAVIHELMPTKFEGYTVLEHVSCRVMSHSFLPDLTHFHSMSHSCNSKVVGISVFNGG